MRGIGDYEQSTAHRSISHEHVLPPQFRDMESARLIARRLGVKGGARLRRMGYVAGNLGLKVRFDDDRRWAGEFRLTRSEEHTSELQSLMRLSYAVFCLKKNKHTKSPQHKVTVHENNA